jgi:hypothetical protein
MGRDGIYELVVVEDDVGAICISDAKIRDHKTDMYHPRLSVDHSKR